MRNGVDRPTVAELVVAAKAGDRAAWTELVARYDGMVRAVATGFRLQPADVGDVAQDTWLRALEQLAGLRRPERFGGWLRTIATRECLGVHAAGRRVHLDSRVAEQIVESTPGPEEHALRAETRGAVRAAVDTLNGRGRVVVENLFFPTRTVDYVMIAKAADIPMGSIGPTRARALELLRHKLEYAGFALRPAVAGRDR